MARGFSSDKQRRFVMMRMKPQNFNLFERLREAEKKSLKRKEEKLETIREREQKKLEDIKDRLQQKQSVAKAKLDISSARVQQKQAMVDEITRERKKIQEIKVATRLAQKQSFELTKTGRVFKGVTKGTRTLAERTVTGIKRTKKFLNKPSTKKAFRKIGKALR